MNVCVISVLHTSSIFSYRKEPRKCENFFFTPLGPNHTLCVCGITADDGFDHELETIGKLGKQEEYQNYHFLMRRHTLG